MVVSGKDAYDTGGKLINRALSDARNELGRQERNITPVDLAANEIYDILRKRLFTSLPDQAEIDDIADAYGRKLEEAAKSKTASRGAEAIADEISLTYPFHPRLKNVIALFKENEQFKQTRGLIELSFSVCCSRSGSVRPMTSSSLVRSTSTFLLLMCATS